MFFKTLNKFLTEPGEGKWGFPGRSTWEGGLKTLTFYFIFQISDKGLLFYKKSEL